MPKDDKIEVEGKVLKSLPGAIFEVELPEAFSNMVIRAYVSGKMQKNLIRLIPKSVISVLSSVVRVLFVLSALQSQNTNNDKGNPVNFNTKF